MIRMDDSNFLELLQSKNNKTTAFIGIGRSHICKEVNILLPTEMLIRKCS